MALCGSPAEICARNVISSDALAVRFIRSNDPEALYGWCERHLEGIAAEPTRQLN